jgi:hypothetical protein
MSDPTPAATMAELHATPDRTNIYMGEEGLESECIHCGWPLFLDAEPDWDAPPGKEWPPDALWQHNDDRYYTPGKPSVCPKEVWSDA